MRSPRSSLLMAIAVCAGALPASSAVAPATFAEIDRKLSVSDWQSARTLALEEIGYARESLYGPLLGGLVARLALAEAGLGRTEEAIWHWHVAQNLDRDALTAEALAVFGDAGALLARHPLRRAGQPLAGLTVHRDEGAGDGVQAARKIDGETPIFSGVVAAVPVPKALRLEAIVDAEGRLQAPVVVGSSAPGMIWEALEALRPWRYEPARRGGEAVAVFRDLRFDLAGRQPLAEVVALSQQAAEAEALLRVGSWEQAERKARRAWGAALDDREPRREQLAAGLALRALADAGNGNASAAICRWQAAQHVDDRLYGLDLTPYGSAGAALDRHRWGAESVPAAVETRAPKVKKWARVQLPSSWSRRVLHGSALLTATIDERGGLHQPLILAVRGGGQAARFSYPAGPLDVTRVGAVAALDALCASTFEPMPGAAGSMRSQLLVEAPFAGRSMPAGPRGVGTSGGTLRGNWVMGPEGWQRNDPKPRGPITLQPQH